MAPTSVRPELTLEGLGQNFVAGVAALHNVLQILAWGDRVDLIAQLLVKCHGVFVAWEDSQHDVREAVLDGKKFQNLHKEAANAFASHSFFHLELVHVEHIAALLLLIVKSEMAVCDRHFLVIYRFVSFFNAVSASP